MPQPITQPCGTYAAARRHERRGEPLCEPCSEARRAWWRDRYATARSLPVWRARDNARTAARMARRRRDDPAWRARVNQRRQQRRRAEAEASRTLIDPIAVERYIAGDTTVHVTRQERTAAVQQLLATGHTMSDTARRLRMSGHSVNAHAARVVVEREAS